VLWLVQGLMPFANNDAADQEVLESLYQQALGFGRRYKSL
jgi:hypothetical protein